MSRIFKLLLVVVVVLAGFAPAPDAEAAFFWDNCGNCSSQYTTCLYLARADWCNDVLVPTYCSPYYWSVAKPACYSGYTECEDYHNGPFWPASCPIGECEDDLVCGPDIINDLDDGEGSDADFLRRLGVDGDDPGACAVAAG